MEIKCSRRQKTVMIMATIKCLPYRDADGQLKVGANLAKIIIQLTLALVPSLLLSFLPFQPSHHAADALTDN